MENDQRDLLMALAYLYSCCGHNWRALPMLLLVLARQPDDRGCLRMLAHVYTMICRSELALVVLDRLRCLEPDILPGDFLLRARALYQLGRLEEARQEFSLYIRVAAA